MSRGEEALFDIGKHCQHPECKQLDFLPFNCDGCKKVFCLDHRSYKSHECPKQDINNRKVIICEICSWSIQTTGHQEEEGNVLLAKHVESGDCDPSKKKKPLKCPVKRCKEILTFSNTCTCKRCGVQVCLKHRFPADHVCMMKHATAAAATIGGGWKGKFLAAFEGRMSQNDCGKSSSTSKRKDTSHSSSVKAC